MPGDESARLVCAQRLPALARRLRLPGGDRQAEAEAVSIRAGAIVVAADRAPVSGADWPALLPGGIPGCAWRKRAACRPLFRGVVYLSYSLQVVRTH